MPWLESAFVGIMHFVMYVQLLYSCEDNQNEKSHLTSLKLPFTFFANLIFLNF